MHITRTLLILLFCQVSLTHLLASSCPCLGPLDIYELNEFDAVFIGELVPPENPQKGYGSWDEHNIFVVEKVYRGDLEPGDSVKVEWKTRTMMSDVYPKVGYSKRWLLYLHKQPESEGYFRKPCTRGRPLLGAEDSQVARNMTYRQDKEEDELVFLDTFETAQNGPVDWDLGDYQAKGQWENGFPTGEWSYFKDGELIASGLYENGKKTGKWKFFGYLPTWGRLERNPRYPEHEFDYSPKE